MKKITLLLLVLCFVVPTSMAAATEVPETFDERLQTALLYSIIADESEAYGQLDYKKLSRYPDDYFNETFMVKGIVLQVLGEKPYYEIRVATSGKYDDAIYLMTHTDPGFRILEDDEITFFCRFVDIYTYQTVIGGSNSLPAFIVDSMTLHE